MEQSGLELKPDEPKLNLVVVGKVGVAIDGATLSPSLIKPSTVSQEGNAAGRDIIAGDSITTHVYPSLAPPQPSTRLFLLLKKLRDEVQSDEKVSTILDELTRFQEPAAKNTRSLEAKLKDGGREDLIIDALWAKEAFTKKLTKFSFFQSAQEVHSLVLARIWSIFSRRIRPLLTTGATRMHVEEQIQNTIIDPLVEDLSTPPLRYLDVEVLGMLYYLTGNCYIEWD